MIINRKSWHYRWIQVLEKFTDNYKSDPITLCQYFWHFIGLNFISLIWGLIIVIGVTFMLTIIPILLWSHFKNGSHSAGTILSVIGIVIGVLVCGGGLVLVMDRLHNEGVPKSLSFLNVVVEMIKATKNKVCPLIRYEE
jgi:uncharacterized membrane protein YhaH (DUF805 family)